MHAATKPIDSQQSSSAPFDLDGPASVKLLLTFERVQSLQRWQRLELLMALYSKIMGTEADYDPNHLELACVLADARHWCSHHNVEFDHALHLSLQHYEEEVADPDL